MKLVVSYLLNHRYAYLGVAAFAAVAAYDVYGGNYHDAILYAAAAVTAAGFKGSLLRVKGLLSPDDAAAVDAGEKAAETGSPLAAVAQTALTAVEAKTK